MHCRSLYFLAYDSSSMQAAVLAPSSCWHCSLSTSQYRNECLGNYGHYELCVRRVVSGGSGHSGRASPWMMWDGYTCFRVPERREKRDDFACWIAEFCLSSWMVYRTNVCLRLVYVANLICYWLQSRGTYIWSVLSIDSLILSTWFSIESLQYNEWVIPHWPFRVMLCMQLTWCWSGGTAKVSGQEWAVYGLSHTCSAWESCGESRCHVKFATYDIDRANWKLCALRIHTNVCQWVGRVSQFAVIFFH